ncbi:MAG: hypothetical protein J6H31_13395 [Butyrivibrio sp.]|nr:hypothetical protein [Butyrivibrio sp.]
MLYFNTFSGWIIDYIIGYTGMMSLYECGYIFNDVITVQYESNPTKRIKDKKEISRILNHLENILTVRLIYFLLASYCLYLYRPENVILYIVLSTGMLIAYSLHNFIRNGWNGFTFMALVHFKYLIPIGIFLSIGELCHYYIWILMIAIVEQSAIHWTEKRYFSLQLIPPDKIDQFRVVYFTLVIFIFAIGVKLNLLDFKYMTLPIFYFFYRVIGVFLIKKSFIKNMVYARRNMHKDEAS